MNAYRFILLALLFALLSTPAFAQTPVGSNDLHYSTILDYSATDLLLSEGGFAATTTYDCAIATMSCAQTTKTSLLPAMLSSLATTSSYKVSPDYSYALVSTYRPGTTPLVELDSVTPNGLVPRATLPPLNALITAVRWAPDGQAVLLSESDGTTQKYVVSTNTLTTLSVSIPVASWITVSPNARYVAYYLPNTQANDETRTIGVVDTVANKIYTLTEQESYWDLLSEGVREFAFSPDSTKLLYFDDRDGPQTLYEVKLSQLTPKASATAVQKALRGTRVTSKTYQIADVQWISNSSILFSANRANPLDWAWYALNLNTNALHQVIDGAAYDTASFRMGSNIVLQTVDAHGRETRMFVPSTNSLVTLSPGVPNAVVMGANQVVKQDGLYGAYLAPATATSTLVVWLHGGPDRQAALNYHSYKSYGGYDWMLNQLQASGVGVLKLDYPGSVGYGMQFAQAVKGGVGTADATRTAQAIKDFAKAHGYANVYVVGNSYGGYLALKLLTSYPQQFAGALSLSGVTDWSALIGNAPSSIFSLDFNGAPGTSNATLYANASVVANLNALANQKVVIVHGDADSEVPYGQAQLLASALNAAGKQFQFYTLPGEDHIYRNPASYTLICNAALNLVGLASSTDCTMR